MSFNLEDGRFVGEPTAEKRPTGSLLARATRDPIQISQQEKRRVRQEPQGVGDNAPDAGAGREEGCEKSHRDPNRHQFQCSWAEGAGSEGEERWRRRGGNGEGSGKRGKGRYSGLDQLATRTIPR